jgi:hypothetical protein
VAEIAHQLTAALLRRQSYSPFISREAMFPTLAAIPAQTVSCIGILMEALLLLSLKITCMPSS